MAEQTWRIVYPDGREIRGKSWRVHTQWGPTKKRCDACGDVLDPCDLIQVGAMRYLCPGCADKEIR